MHDEKKSQVRSHKSKFKGQGFKTLFLRYSSVHCSLFIVLAAVAFANEGGGEEAAALRIY